MVDEKKQLRSRSWYGKQDKDGFIHRSWMKNQGFPDQAFDGRPVIGICNTWSELTPCNTSLRDIAEAVKRGVWEAGGFPVEFPVISLGETQMKPTAMLFRNLLAMDVEESCRGYGLDGVVLLGGCDKTTPGQLMGAMSVNLPTVVVSAGPMLNGNYRGKPLGSGTGVWQFSEAVRAGEMTLEEFMSAESAMSRSKGVCMTMGTASTISCLVEAMGMSLAGNGTLPAVDARRFAMAHRTGNRIVKMVHEGLTPDKILTKGAFENAIVMNAAIGGSTNAVVHLLAIAGRVGVDLTLDDFDRKGSTVPLLVNLQPSGEYLMEDLHYAGGVPAVQKALGELYDGSLVAVTGQPIGEQYADAEIFNDKVIGMREKPFNTNSGIKVLRGNLSPQGAIIKPSAASKDLMVHEGEALVFSSIEDFKARIDDPDLPVTKDTVLVLQGCGPKGYPGMPEVGNMPLPPKILEAGIKDMVRISDARMSGTAYGTVVLHVSPEAAAGGTLALVRTGDRIRLDVPKGELNVLVEDAELARRKAEGNAKAEAGYARPERGYYRLYVEHVTQADKGADLDFLVGKSSNVVTRESH